MSASTNFINRFFRIVSNHRVVTKQLVEAAIAADTAAANTVIVPPVVRKGREDLRSLRNQLVALSNGQEVDSVTADDPRLAALEAAVNFFNL